MLDVNKMAVLGLLTSNGFVFNPNRKTVRLIGENLFEDDSDMVDFESSHAYKKIGGKYLHVVTAIGIDRELRDSTVRVQFAITNSAYVSADRATETFYELQEDEVSLDGLDIINTVNVQLRMVLDNWRTLSRQVIDTAPPGIFEALFKFVDKMRRYFRF